MKFSSPNFDLEVPFFCTFIYHPNYSPIPYLLPKNDECSNPELKANKKTRNHRRENDDADPCGETAAALKRLGQLVRRRFRCDGR